MADFEIKIDKGVPLPEDTRSKSNYPFADMEVGDSIFIPLVEGDNAQRMKNRLSQATRTFGKKQDPEQHFIIRYRLEKTGVVEKTGVGDKETSGVRIWRKD